MSLKKEYLIRKRFKRSLEKKEEGWEARMGDGEGNVKVAGNDNYRYVRPKHMDLPMVVRRGSAPDLEEVRVWVTRGWGKKKGWRIQGVMDPDDTSSGVDAHADTHYEDGSDPVWITDRQITPLLVYATTGMTVHINGGYITYHGQPLWITAEDISMTSHIPGAGARYSLIRVSNAGAMSVQDGTPVDSLADLADDDIPECAAGYAAIAFVRLYFGQTALSRVTTNPDVKMLVWGGGLFDVGGFGGLDYFPVEASGGTLNRIAGSVTIVDDAKNNSFPVLLKLATGDLAVFYKQATSHAYDADSVVLMRTSSDNGATWSAASTILTDATYDIQPGGGIVLSTGRIVLAINLNTIGPDGAMADSTRIIYSDDDGANWSAAYTINSTFTDYDHSTGTNLIELPDGTLRIALFGENAGDTYASVNIYTSDDEGEIWGDEKPIADGETNGRNYQEPNLVQIHNGQLLCIMRSDTTPVSSSQFYRSISSDGGSTWSTPKAMFVATGAPRTIQLINGMLLIVYRDASDLQADYRISRDNGYLWEDAVALSTGASVQMTYASAVEYEEGVIGVAWSDEDSDTNSDLYYCRFYTTVEGGQLVSNAPDGIAPLAVNSDTVVPDLNADLLDGFHAADIVGGGGVIGSLTDWTPTITQSGSVACTITYAKYCLIGPLCYICANLAVTAAGTTGNDIKIGGLPKVPAANGTYGTFWINDNGTGWYAGAALYIEANVFKFRAHLETDDVGTDPNFALASGDAITFFAIFPYSS